MLSMSPPQKQTSMDHASEAFHTMLSQLSFVSDVPLTELQLHDPEGFAWDGLFCFGLHEDENDLYFDAHQSFSRETGFNRRSNRNNGNATALSPFSVLEVRGGDDGSQTSQGELTQQITPHRCSARRTDKSPCVITSSSMRISCARASEYACRQRWKNKDDAYNNNGLQARGVLLDMVFAFHPQNIMAQRGHSSSSKTVVTILIAQGFEAIFHHFDSTFSIARLSL